MSSTVTVRPAKGVRGIGMFSLIVGVVLIVAGIVVWIVVSMTLSDEQITVSDDATMFAGQEVAGPFTAYAQAEVINEHALEMADGMTYAELDQDDPTRETVMDASFLRASLFTSVVAFGVCALVIGLGLMFILIGAALRRLAGGPSVAVDTPSYSAEDHSRTSAGRADPGPAPERRPVTGAHAADRPATPAAGTGSGTAADPTPTPRPVDDTNPGPSTDPSTDPGTRSDEPGGPTRP